MLAEIFMLRLEAMARIAAQEASKYSSGTVRERRGAETASFTEYPLLAILKAWLYFVST